MIAVKVPIGSLLSVQHCFDAAGSALEIESKNVKSMSQGYVHACDTSPPKLGKILVTMVTMTMVGWDYSLQTYDKLLCTWQ
jgi:hypothetical protein